jgi:asparagine synthase (glutamine-hydrolysing)
MLCWQGGVTPRLTAYFDLAARARDAQAAPVTLSDRQAADELERLLAEAVAAQMVADVPLGAFLSGGIDSSAVVALMQRHARRPVRTFTIGFAQRDYDEARHAAAIARHLGTEHTELYVGERELLALVPRLPEIYDEPFADASQLPTLLISALAREHVTVALSGDGGDELFAGYNRHLWSERLWGAAAPYPRGLRRLAGRVLAAAPPHLWHLAGRLMPARSRPRQLGDKMQKLGRLLAEPDLAGVYDAVRSVNPAAAGLLRVAAPAIAPHPPPAGLDNLTALQLADALGYLPDDVLTKVDRASMSQGLEVRVPLLDLRIVDFALRLPARLKVRAGQGKWLLRQVLDRHVPQALVDRPKAGFSVPMDAWLRGPLRDWAEALLLRDPADEDALLDGAALRSLWRMHQQGRADLGNRLWPALVLLAWLERWGR